MELDVEEMEDVKFEADIDSILIATTTLEPFKGRYKFIVRTKPRVISRCDNTKLTNYLNARDKFVGSSSAFPAPFAAAPDHVDAKRQWYEFELGTIDNRAIFVLFQVDKSSNTPPTGSWVYHANLDTSWTDPCDEPRRLSYTE